MTSVQTAVSAQLFTSLSTTVGGNAESVVNTIGSSVMATASQLSAMDCAVMACGNGTCVLTADMQPQCDCTGTNMTGNNCNIPVSGEAACRLCVCVSVCFVSLPLIATVCSEQHPRGHSSLSFRHQRRVQWSRQLCHTVLPWITIADVHSLLCVRDLP